MKKFLILLLFLPGLLLMSCAQTASDPQPETAQTSADAPSASETEVSIPQENAAEEKARAEGKQILTLGVLVQEDNPVIYDAEHLAEQFNRQSDDYWLSVRAYHNDATLLADLTTDNAPDLLEMTGVSAPLNGNNFTDMLPLIDADPELDREGFTGNLLESLLINDALYMLPNTVHISTMVAWADVAGEQPGWTVEEIRGIRDKLEEGYSICPTWRTFDNVFYFLCRGALDRFVDYENYICHFEREEFKELLRFCNDLPRTEIAPDGPPDYRREVADIDWITGPDRIHGIKYARGDNYVYIGYPCDNGTGSYFAPGMSCGLQLAIPYRAANAEASFEVIRYILGREVQTDPLYSQIPVMAEYLKEDLQKAVGQKVDHGGGIVTEITEEDIRKFRELLDSATVYLFNRPVIIEIIEEEAKAYFAGSKSVDEVADVIQNRVQLYLDTNR
ncbi:MAG: carbohydrate ABC transporter substrate-binding protein [Lachnospiraceae bacterium]|nr:carbohydrate ABC transporter substrate-binding protein [Lachnospiraceae bacterium]